MSSSEIHKSRQTDQPAEQTGDFLAHNTAGDDAASITTSKHRPQFDPLLALLRPPQADGELGRLAHFAITRLLGRGGMGAVFEANDLLLHRTVALKVMRPELTARPEARERFLREARTAGGLDHDHIIAVHEVAEDNGVWFIVMPLLKGEPLDVRLAREGRLSMKAVLKLGRETAEALAAAHAQGLVHRDVKPANLWLEGTGDAGGAGFRRVKILDFGLARAVQDDQHLTAEGGLLGTPAYMAPEQAAGEEVDHRADLFNLGAVLYRCCAGETPFPGKTTAAVMTALLTKDAAPVGEKNPTVPPALADLIMRLLAKAPADRPQTAAEADEALRRIEQEGGTGTVQAPTLPAPRRRRLSALTLCLLALLGLGVAATAGVIVVKVRTPDGKETAVTAPTGSNVNVNAKGEVIITLPTTPAEPAAKADPPELEFRLKEGDSAIHALVITPDGKKAVAGYQDGYLRVWDLESRKVVQTYNAGSWVRALALHPDGNTVAVNCEDGSLFTWDIAKGELVQRFTGDPVVSWSVSFARHGELLIISDDKTKTVVSWETANGKQKVLASYSKAATYGMVQVAPDGEHVAVMTEGEPVRSLDLSSGKAIWSSRWRGWKAAPVFTPDGKKMAFFTGWGVAVCDLDSPDPKSLFGREFNLGIEGLTISPNNRLMASVGLNKHGQVELWDLAGPPYPIRVWAGSIPSAAHRAAFSPDGRRLFSTYDDGTICVFKVPENVPIWHGFPPLDPDWLARTTKLAPDEQIKEVTAELTRRNPGFTDSLTVWSMDGDGRAVNVGVRTVQLEDLSPFRGLPSLRELGVTPKEGVGKVWNLSCLAGMNLSALDLRVNRVFDLSPLQDMHLTGLLLDQNPVYDLTPLRKMKLQTLGLPLTEVDDLALLHNMPLEQLYINYSPVKDFSPLQGTPLEYLYLSAEGAADFESLRGLSIQEIGLHDVEHTGLTPSQRDVLRSMPKLKTINGKPAADFWKAIDAGEKPKPGG